MEQVNTFVEADQMVKEAKAKKRESQLIASQYDSESRQVFSTGSKQANEIRRQGGLNSSAATASLAASGASTSGRGGSNILATVQENTDFNSLAAIFEGGQKSRTLRKQAGATRREGDRQLRSARNAANAKRIGSILSLGSKAVTGGFG